MFEYIIKRLGLSILTLLVILAVSYTLVRLAPGDPTRSSILGGQTPGENLQADKGAFAGNRAMREKLYLDKPVYIGFAFWLKGVLTRGDFGMSASVDPGRPVTELIMERLPITVRLNVIAIIITYLLAIPLGIYSAVYPDSMFDRITTFGLFFLYSLPVIWVSLMLQALVCEGGMFPLFPLKGLSVENANGLNSWQMLLATAAHYVLPVTCLAYAGFAGLSRYARTGMIEVINQDYIRTARAKGLPEYIVIFKHALRNAMIILITLFAGLLPGLVAGSIIIEHVFSIPGMGSLSLMALSSRDYPLQMALFGFAGILTLSGIFIADLLYVVVDPRISFSNKSS